MITNIDNQTQCEIEKENVYHYIILSVLMLEISFEIVIIQLPCGGKHPGTACGRKQ